MLIKVVVQTLAGDVEVVAEPGFLEWIEVGTDEAKPVTDYVIKSIEIVG
jgi:hypothetical protein